MSPEMTRLLDVLDALPVALGVAGVLDWMRRGSQAEDDMVVEAADLVLDSISDADATTRVECMTCRNWRDDVTVGEAQDMHRERELRRFGWGRN